MEVKIHESWKTRLQGEFDSPYFAALAAEVKKAYAAGRCYPPGPQIFAAFDKTPFDKVKAVIIGQDPYHGPSQAHGLAFSVKPPTPPPPSLLNIFAEIEREFGVAVDKTSGDLTRWAESGVLLLNSSLTVAQGAPMSHHGFGWERFTDAAIAALAREREHLVYMLWGTPARKKGAMVDRARNLVLEAPHPSPLSAYRGFFGCGHFKKANEYMRAHGVEPVAWF